MLINIKDVASQFKIQKCIRKPDVLRCIIIDKPMTLVLTTGETVEMEVGDVLEQIDTDRYLPMPPDYFKQHYEVLPERAMTDCPSGFDFETEQLRSLYNKEVEL